ncbi:hypothetical protein VV02_18465 [Luteipulveratus mongoliensis]|uniref:Uncharacterized protein n=1 Tax=Luteipulveratus mongoliensis TaxID=571913 RepID=A0A0K1JKX2_9MICO|nr:hypothetical protein VV02_18465 [Luteipulveratus mongoliensis]
MSSRASNADFRSSGLRVAPASDAELDPEDGEDGALEALVIEPVEEVADELVDGDVDDVAAVEPGWSEQPARTTAVAQPATRRTVRFTSGTYPSLHRSGTGTGP